MGPADDSLAVRANEGPLDFTASTLSNVARNEGEQGGTGRGGAPGTRAAAGPSSGPARSEPAIVPVAALGRAPRAPGLDRALERNYPSDARRAGIAGKAVLRVRIQADGRVSVATSLSESYPGFGDACARTVREARWEPPLDREGRAVATEITYVCLFEVRS
jgi:protein TonB